MNEVMKIIEINENTDKQTTQVLVEGDVIVPDIKPDIDRVLTTYAWAVVENVDLSENRINFGGKLFLNVIYIAKNENKSIHNMNLETQFSDYMNYDGGSGVDLDWNISNIELRLLNDRKVNFRCVIDICANVKDNREISVVSSLDNLDEKQMIKKIVQTDRLAENKKEDFIIKEELSLPVGKSDINEVLRLTCQLRSIEVKLKEDCLNVLGYLCVNMLYKGETDNVIEFAEFEIPIDGNIEINDINENMYCESDLKIKNIYYVVRPDENNEDRIIDLEVVIGSNMNIYERGETEVLEDAYEINKEYKMNCTEAKIPKFVCHNKNQYPVKETVNIDITKPNMLQVFNMWGTVHIDDYKLYEDKTVIEGVIECEVLYVAKSDDNPINSFKTYVPFKTVLETQTVQDTKHYDVSIKANIEHMGYNMLSDREIEMRLVLDFDTIIKELVPCKLITDIEICDIDKCYLDKLPSIVIYIVRKGDTLWKIAKRFNVPLQEIIDVNNFENPDLIYPGDKVLIIKKSAD